MSGTLGMSQTIMDLLESVVSGFQNDKKYVPSENEVDACIKYESNQGLANIVKRKNILFNAAQLEKLKMNTSPLVKQAILERMDINVGMEYLETAINDYSWMVQKAAWKRHEWSEDRLIEVIRQCDNTFKIGRTLVEVDSIGAKVIQELAMSPVAVIRLKCLRRVDASDVLSVCVVRGLTDDKDLRVSLEASKLLSAMERKSLNVMAISYSTEKIKKVAL